MLAMALPIALVWLMHSERGASGILYGLAVCLLLAGVVRDLPQERAARAGRR